MAKYLIILGILCYIIAFVMLILYLVFDISIYSKTCEMKSLILWTVLAGGVLQGIGVKYK
jgi:uncharacterized membrane protein